jgi:thermitase
MADRSRVEVVLSCRPWAPALLFLVCWSQAVLGATDQWVVAVGGPDQAGLLLGRAKREHLTIRRLDEHLRSAPPGWDRYYIIQAPSFSAWADSLLVRGASWQEDAWFGPLALGAPRASFAPDDPEFAAGRQWGLSEVHAADAWTITTGDSRFPLAALDTGVDSAHPDLQASGAGGAPRLVALSALAGKESDVADSLGHGTMVCGVMAALTNNHLGIAGMAGGGGPSTSAPGLYSIKVTSGAGQAARGTDLARGIVMAVSLGARAINISFAGTGTSDALRGALYWAASQGCVVTCGAGNSADDRPQYPAAYADLGLCVAVTAADSDGSQPAFVTRGGWIDGAAPGVNILSTWPTYPNAYGSDLRDYASSSGTSFAAPLVAGIAELATAVDSSLAGGDFRELFRRTGSDRSAAGGVRGADAAALLGALRPPYRVEHGDAGAEQWWDAGEETLRIRRSAYWRSAGPADGDYVARRFEVRATAEAAEPLDGAATWIRPTGNGGWKSGRTHDGEECWGEVVSEVSPQDAVLRTYVYRIDVPAAGCDTCAAIGWMPRAPWEVTLPWTRWGAEQVAAGKIRSVGPRIELIGSSPALGAVRFRLTGFASRALPEALLIYDVRGSLIRRAAIPAGSRIATWNGNDEAGRIAPAGLYIARLPASAAGLAIRFVRLRSR